MLIMTPLNKIYLLLLSLFIDKAGCQYTLLNPIIAFSIFFYNLDLVVS